MHPKRVISIEDWPIYKLALFWGEMSVKCVVNRFIIA